MPLQLVEKLATGNFFEDFVAKIIHLWGVFFLKKAPHTPAKKRLIKGISSSAEDDLGLCPKYPPPFEKGGRKLLN